MPWCTPSYTPNRCRTNRYFGEQNGTPRAGSSDNKGRYRSCFEITSRVGVVIARALTTLLHESNSQKRETGEALESSFREAQEIVVAEIALYEAQGEAGNRDNILVARVSWLGASFYFTRRPS